jgi:hypothetical protein
MTTRFKRESALLLFKGIKETGLMRFIRSYTDEYGTYVKEYRMIKDGETIAQAATILHENYFEVKIVSKHPKYGESIVSFTKNLK